MDTTYWWCVLLGSGWIAEGWARVAQILTALLLDKRSLAKYDSKISLVAEFESRKARGLDFRIRSHSSDDFVLIQRSSNVCDLQKLRSSANEACESQRWYKQYFQAAIQISKIILQIRCFPCLWWRRLVNCLDSADYSSLEYFQQL